MSPRLRASSVIWSAVMTMLPLRPATNPARAPCVNADCALMMISLSSWPFTTERPFTPCAMLDVSNVTLLAFSTRSSMNRALSITKSCVAPALPIWMPLKPSPSATSSASLSENSAVPPAGAPRSIGTVLLFGNRRSCAPVVETTLPRGAVIAMESAFSSMSPSTRAPPPRLKFPASLTCRSVTGVVPPMGPPTVTLPPIVSNVRP